jgi:hypothetical protein
MPLGTSTRGFAPEGVEYCLKDAGPAGPLESSGVIYRKGLFTRAGAAVKVKLPKGAATLVFTPGIASQSSPAAGVFSVEIAGKAIWAAKSGDVRGKAVSVPVAGAAEATLTFESSPPGVIGAGGVWGDALVTLGEGAR